MLTLVTGATGLLGNNVMRRLLAEGQRVRVLVRPTADPRPLAGLPVEQVPGDVRQARTVNDAMAGVDRVVHAAAVLYFGWSRGEELRLANVEGTRHVARAARLAGARLVHISSVDALGWGTRAQPANEDSPPNERVPCPYVVTKRQAEEVVQQEIAAGLDAVIVNPAYVLGPWDWKPSSGRMLLEVARGMGLWVPPGGNDFCDARHVAEGVLAALERGQTGRRYILGGQALSYPEAWTLFAEITGARPPIRIMRRPVMRLMGAVGDRWGRYRGQEPMMNSAAMAMIALEHHFDCRRAIAELGYNPGTARQAAQAAWDWFCEFGYAPARSHAVHLPVGTV